MNRRDAIKAASVTTGLGLLGTVGFAKEKKKQADKFKFSLNTSTISGQKLGVQKYIEIAARAGYDCMELWLPDLKVYMDNGGTLPALKKLIDDSKVPVVNAIGFAPWMIDDEEKRNAGFKQMRQEMEIMAALGCPRIAAPSAGIGPTAQLDMFIVGERFAKLIELGKETGVTPQLEFWGASRFHHIGQALMASAVANNPGAKILADVYHLFRGNSGFESLKMIDGSMIEIFHMNDYPGSIPREKQEDKDRIYPGDGVAPFKQILTDLKNMKGPKVLSLELFNREYWAQDPLQVAKTGLEKMKKVVQGIV
ncbi:sugar phosphate isomerase/epimerase family protein [Chryseolinea sp. H1M3-3]|uniref:sugar phosphate isomerase/epimerase family protein n=1 Tax=Chryseolinea sp. H1M3-3 TaxID=3034144 RepID=UPI0023EB2C65|nr:sugar phosphate isomerase/epimerase family protein [Chryseolinea sp. H1M3-3]